MTNRVGSVGSEHRASKRTISALAIDKFDGGLCRLKETYALERIVTEHGNCVDEVSSKETSRRSRALLIQISYRLSR
jgi:hypothetical protein